MLILDLFNNHHGISFYNLKVFATQFFSIKRERHEWPVLVNQAFLRIFKVGHLNLYFHKLVRFLLLDIYTDFSYLCLN